MHTQFKRLIALLDEEAEFYQKLLGCIQTERQAIIDLDFELLGDIGRQKETMILKQRELAKKRDQALMQITGEMTATTEEMTLEQLSRRAPSPYNEELQRCRSRLRDWPPHSVPKMSTCSS